MPDSTPPLLESPDDRLRYVITRGDIVRGTLRCMLYNRPVLIYLAAVTVFVLGLSVRDFAAKDMAPALIVLAVLVQAGLIGLLMVFGMTVVTLLGLYFGRGRGVLGEHELSLTPEGLRERTDVNDSLHRWSGLGEVRETGAFYFIRATAGSGNFHLVPKSRPAQILAGNPAAFISRLRERQARGG